MHSSEHNYVHADPKTTEDQYSPMWLEQARLVSSLFYGTHSKFANFWKQELYGFDCFSMEIEHEAKSQIYLRNTFPYE